MNTKISLIALLFFSASSFAQTGPGISNMTLKETRTFAESEVVRLKKELAESATNPDLLPCDFYLMETQLAYNEWFLKPDHYRALESGAQDQIDGMPADGLLRYLEFQNQFKGKCKSLRSIPSQSFGLPYVKYDEIPAVEKQLQKQAYAVVTSEMKFVTTPGEIQIQTTEVTQSQWFEIMRTKPSYFKDRSHCPETWKNEMCPQNPVEQISWDEIQGFLQQLSERNDEYTYRLPTEAEWENAVGGAITDLPNGAWFMDNSDEHTHEIGTKAANAYGLYDMNGNVYEFVQDRYSGSPTGLDYVYRGGSWKTDGVNFHSVIRGGHYHQWANDQIGFRLVRARR